MHKPHNSRTRILSLLLGVAALVMAGWVGADPPAFWLRRTRAPLC